MCGDELFQRIFGTFGLRVEDLRPAPLRAGPINQRDPLSMTEPRKIHGLNLVRASIVRVVPIPHLLCAVISITPLLLLLQCLQLGPHLRQF
jgi:hypothetical protein